jgi:hypothetical protein
MASLQEMLAYAQAIQEREPGYRIGKAVGEGVSKGISSQADQMMQMYRLKQRIDAIKQLAGGGEDKTEAGRLETSFGVTGSGEITASIKPKFRASDVPDGYEITGYYQDGTPMIKKAKDNKSIRLVYDAKANKYMLPGSDKAIDPNEYTSQGYDVRVDRMNDVSVIPARPAPQGASAALLDTRDAIAKLEEMEKMVRSNPKIKTGLLHPQYARNTVGRVLMQAVNDPDMAQFGLVHNQYQDAYRKAITGAQASFPELSWLKSSNPDAAMDTPRIFYAKVKQAIKEMKGREARMVSQMQAQNYIIPDYTGNDNAGEPTPESGGGSTDGGVPTVGGTYDGKKVKRVTRKK